VHQAFHYDEAQRRFVPNALDLNAFQEGEPPQEMPAQFAVPELILEVERCGMARTFAEIHADAGPGAGRRATEPAPLVEAVIPPVPAEPRATLPPDPESDSTHGSVEQSV
jgi:hypothetical protein